MSNEVIKTYSRPPNKYWKVGDNYGNVRVEKSGGIIVIYSFVKRQEKLAIYTDKLRLYKGYKPISKEEYYGS